MGRSLRELRRAIAPLTPSKVADARTAVPPERPLPLPERIKARERALKVPKPTL